MNETQVIVKKLKFLRSPSDKPGKIKHDPAMAMQDLEAQLAALKVRFAHSQDTPFLTACRL